MANITAIVKKQERLVNGDIFKDIEFIEFIEEVDGVVLGNKISYPLVILLTQDCDLEQDFKARMPKDDKEINHDKWLLSVLVVPIYNAEHVFAGNHLEELDMKMGIINKSKTPGDMLRQNSNPRYHYLQFDETIDIVPSIIDFKHFFSISKEYLQRVKSKNYICTINELYREDITQRFAAFLSRLALPEIK